MTNEQMKQLSGLLWIDEGCHVALSTADGSRHIGTVIASTFVSNMPWAVWLDDGSGRQVAILWSQVCSAESAP